MADTDMSDKQRVVLMDSLRVALQDIESDMRGINPRLELYGRLTQKKKDIEARMKALVKEAPVAERSKLGQMRGAKLRIKRK